MLPPLGTMLLVVPILAFPCICLAQDRSTGTRPIESEFNNRENYPAEITEAQLRQMTLSDPKLRVAYFWLIKAANGGHEITSMRFPPMVEVLKDVRSRGDTTIPLWLDMMENNHGAVLEYMIPHVIARIGTINMEPFVEYFRTMIQTRGDTISGTAFGVALGIFLEFGKKEAAQLAFELAEKRPFLAPYVQAELETEERRNRGRLTSGPVTSPPSAPPDRRKLTDSHQVPHRASSTNSSKSDKAKEQASSPERLIMIVGGCVLAIGLLLLLLKRGK